MTCDCIDSTNNELADLNTMLVTTMFAKPDRVVLRTDQVKSGRGQKKAMAALASYCPFCGRNYDEAKNDHGVDRIAAERRRQLGAKSYSPDRDDAYADNELAAAAWCYLGQLFDPDESQPAEWPWDPRHWRPGTPTRNLEKAGALIAAELGRRKRAHDAFAALVVEACVEGGADRDYSLDQVALALPDHLKEEGIEVGDLDHDWEQEGATALAEDLVLRHLDRFA